jgi:hypothetical protein
MAIFNLKTKASVIVTAAIVAFGVTAYGNQAVSHGNGTSDPTAIGTFEKATVGGRSGCDVQSWPYIAPECLEPSHGIAAKADRTV